MPRNQPLPASAVPIFLVPAGKPGDIDDDLFHRLAVAMVDAMAEAPGGEHLRRTVPPEAKPQGTA